MEYEEWIGDNPTPVLKDDGERVIVDCLPPRVLVSGALLREGDPRRLERNGRCFRIVADNAEASYRLVRRWRRLDLFGAERV